VESWEFMLSKMLESFGPASCAMHGVLDVVFVSEYRIDNIRMKYGSDIHFVPRTVREERRILYQWNSFQTALIILLIPLPISFRSPYCFGMLDLIIVDMWWRP